MSIENIAVFFSFISIVCFCISAFKKNKKGIVGLYLCCDICDLIMYILLGATTGIASVTVNLCKDASYSKLNSIKFTVIFAVAKVVLMILGYEDFSSGILIIIEIIAIPVLIFCTAQQFRILMSIRQCTWALYDYIHLTKMIFIFTLIGLICYIISIIKEHRSNLKEASK